MYIESFDPDQKYRISLAKNRYIDKIFTKIDPQSSTKVDDERHIEKSFFFSVEEVQYNRDVAIDLKNATNSEKSPQHFLTVVGECVRVARWYTRVHFFEDKYFRANGFISLVQNTNKLMFHTFYSGEK
jgi:hypothetical protein